MRGWGGKRSRYLQARGGYEKWLGRSPIFDPSFLCMLLATATVMYAAYLSAAAERRARAARSGAPSALKTQNMK